jgi:hypothetical protein
MMNKLGTVAFSCLLILLAGVVTLAQQVADPHFDTRVENPAFTKNFPRVLFDEAHYNFDTINNRYKPFADLLFNDGYQVAVNRKPFAKASLATFKIVVIVNPLGGEDMDEEGADGPAFTTEECDALIEWIRGGGALLLIVDHAPFASAAGTFAERLGVDMSKGSTEDAANADKEFNSPSVIVYSRENQLLQSQAITNGRSDAERVKRVLVFGGQSLKGPPGSEVLLKLADTAADKIPAPGKDASAAGRAQGLAFRLGKGRVVVLGDAAMLSAQLSGSDNQPVGMNVPGVDNRQLTLNIIHWLSGVLK